MPISTFMRIGKNVSKIAKEGKKAQAKEPSPPRQQRRAESAVSRPSTSPRARANQAANMLHVPGRDNARTVGSRTAREMKKLGL